MLNNIGWLTLSLRREKLRAIIFYKIINNLVDVSTDGIPNPLTVNTRGHSQRFKLNTNAQMLTAFCIPFFKTWKLTTHAALQDFKKTIFESCY